MCFTVSQYQEESGWGNQPANTETWFCSCLIPNLVGVESRLWGAWTQSLCKWLSLEVSDWPLERYMVVLRGLEDFSVTVFGGADAFLPTITHIPPAVVVIEGKDAGALCSEVEIMCKTRLAESLMLCTATPERQ